MTSRLVAGGAFAAVAAILSIVGTARGNLIDFEELILGTRYFDGEVITSAGVNMTVLGTGHIDVEGFNLAGGAGNELEFFGGGNATGGMSAVFDFGADVENLSLLFAYGGGAANLSINGDTIILFDFAADLPASLGGVNITLTGNAFDPSMLSFDGVVSAFSIGGQEFNVDNVSFDVIPAPGAIALFGLALMRRRPRHRATS